MSCLYHRGFCQTPVACQFAPLNLMSHMPTSPAPSFSMPPPPSYQPYQMHSAAGTHSSAQSVFDSLRGSSAPAMSEWSCTDSLRVSCQILSVVAIIAGIVAPYFVYPLIGTGLFFGGIAAFVISSHIGAC